MHIFLKQAKQSILKSYSGAKRLPVTLVLMVSAPGPLKTVWLVADMDGGVERLGLMYVFELERSSAAFVGLNFGFSRIL
jgi:hypothetical protein